MWGTSLTSVRELRVLFVCTANICRSPTAELLARYRFGEDRALFRSAGFMESGRSVPEDLQEVLDENQVAATSHASSRLDPETMNAADLILTMEGRHIQQLTVEHPPALPHSLPLREAAERLQGGTGLDELLEQLQSRDPRDYLSTKWDVDDPYKRGKKRYRKMVTEVDKLVDQVVGSLLQGR